MFTILIVAQKWQRIAYTRVKIIHTFSCREKQLTIQFFFHCNDYLMTTLLQQLTLCYRKSMYASYTQTFMALSRLHKCLTEQITSSSPTRQTETCQQTEQCKPMSLAVKFNCACREIFNVVPSGLHELFQTISKLSFLYTLDHFHQSVCMCPCCFTL